MTDKREVELLELDITDDDRDLAKALKLPDDLKPDSYEEMPWIIKMVVWMGSARVCRERQLRDALTKISQLEQQLAESEARTHAVEEDLKVTMRALELAFDFACAESRSNAIAFWINKARQDFAAERGSK